MSVVGVVLRGLDCAIYGCATIAFVAYGVMMIIAIPQWTARALLPLVAGVLSGGLVGFRIVHVYRALRYGEAAEAEIIRSSVGWVRPTGTLWGELVSGKAVRVAYKIRGREVVDEYYLPERWAKSPKPGTKIWVLRVTGWPLLLAPYKPRPA